MELLLNLCWLFLTAPALVLWLRQRRASRPAQFALTLACLLFLLFPVISVTDDLNATHQEMEESACVKRGSSKTANPQPRERNHDTLMIAVTWAQVSPYDEVCGLAQKIEGSTLRTYRITAIPGRAPPSIHLS